MVDSRYFCTGMSKGSSIGYVNSLPWRVVTQPRAYRFDHLVSQIQGRTKPRLAGFGNHTPKVLLPLSSFCCIYLWERYLSSLPGLIGGSGLL